MSMISLADAKAFLDVIHDEDDVKLQLLLDAAEGEAGDFLNADLNSWSELPFAIVMGTLLILQANYQASPDDIPKLRAAAETKLMPHRISLGV